MVKVLDKVGIRSVRNTGYRTQPGSRTLRSLRSGQRESSLLHRGKSQNFGIESRGSLRAVIFKVTRFYQGRATPLYG